MNTILTIDRYDEHLKQTATWLMRSIEKGRGGSCAYFSPLLGWSLPYPETTGYLIPTLLKLSSHFDDSRYRSAAIRIGQWLLSIQYDHGGWEGGLHKSGQRNKPSVFNTGQILNGMVRLFQSTQDEQWLDAARRAARWLAEGVDERGLWPASDYKSEQTPSYYTRVAWPMLEAWAVMKEDAVRDAAERYLRIVLQRRLDNGSFTKMGFKQGGPAFTHTIAYTLRGLMESARLTDSWDIYGDPCVDALEVLLEKAQLLSGNLPGAYDKQWAPYSGYSCLTGNVQVALCLLLWESRNTDLRIVNGAARLVDNVCDSQKLHHPLASMRGAVAGSRPFWGDYMRWRYPNWAAKFHCDAMLRLQLRLDNEAGK